MKKPCDNCPFLIGSNFEESMDRERAQEIADSLDCDGAAFPCHETVDYDNGSTAQEKFCVGALLTMENDGGAHLNQMVRIQQRLRMIGDLDELEGADRVYGSLQEWVENRP